MQIKSSTLKEIAELIEAEFIGNPDHVITGFNEIHRVEEGDVVFVDHPKYYEKALQSAATTIIINKRVDCPEGKGLIIHDEPFTAFNLLTQYFQPKNYYQGGSFSPSSKFGKNTTIMQGCYLGNNVKVGNNCVLHPNVIIYNWL
jgi:UDP-3-O-[3-hydroxymyristoyl] glucosamine N-acyltransferase